MVHWWRTSAILLLASSAVTLSSVGAVPGAFSSSIQSPAASTTSLSDYAREFNDERFDVREAATRRLIDDAQIQTDDILEFVDAQWETLAPEAVERFLLVSRERYIASPGAIGIEFGPSAMATIDNVILGTPASKVLRRGDQILSLNGEDLPPTRTEQQPELLRRMAGLKAGDLVQAKIRRGLDELDVEFALADPKLLPRFESFIVTMQREMLQQWNALRAERIPLRPMMIDMDVAGLALMDSHPRAASGESADATIIEELSHRRAEVSREIARVMEQSSPTDSPQRRRELENECLPLINDLARLNVRIRLLENAISGRPMR